MKATRGERKGLVGKVRIGASVERMKTKFPFRGLVELVLPRLVPIIWQKELLADSAVNYELDVLGKTFGDLGHHVTF